MPAAPQPIARSVRPERPASGRFGRVAAAPIALAVALAVLSDRAAGQLPNLPTVRVQGPLPEERVLMRVLHELRAEYNPADTVARRRVRFKLDTLLLATLSDRQREGLQALATGPATRADTLRALARGKYDPEHPVVGELYAALARVGGAERARLSAASAARGDPRVEPDSLEPPKIRERAAQHLLAAALEDSTVTPERRAKIDSATRLAVTLVVHRKFEERRGLFPVQTRTQAEVFWRQRGLAPLNVGAVGGSGASGVAYTEIAAPLLQFLRLSVNAVLAAGGAAGGTPGDRRGTTTGAADTTAGAVASSDPRVGTANTAAVQRLVTGGGLFNVAFAWPVYHARTADGHAGVTALVVPRLGLTAPAFGPAASDSTTLAADAGVELHWRLLDLADGVGVVGQVRGAYARGSRRFGDALGLGKDHLGYATAALGFVFGGQYMLTVSRPAAGPPSVRRSDWVFGLTTWSGAPR